MNQKKWRKRKPQRQYSDFDGIVEQLAAINGIDDIERFTNPKADELHDPYLLKNIDLARNRILKAIKDNEKIAIHSDIDSDGVSATAIMYRYLRNYTDNVSYFHSQRSVGHGVYNSKEDIPEGTSLLIVLDSSSSESDTCKEISERGIDIVIIDHHELERENPHCILVNHQQHDCLYPNKFSSGSLLAWKMCQVLEDTLGGDYVSNLVDLAGFGLLSDQMSMLEFENRYIVKQMLDNLNNLGIITVLQALGKKPYNLTSTDINFSAVPMVNSATRLDRIELVLEMLTSDDPELVKVRVKEIKKINENRKKKQRESVNEITPKVNINDRCIIIVEPLLGKGFNGLIAGELAGQYQRPVVVLGESEDKSDEYHGSFRSFGFFKFLDFVGTLPEVLFCGGHQAAGGLGIKKADLEKFRESVNNGLANENFEQVFTYDLELDASEIDEDMIRQINSLYRITGNNVREAKFLIKDLFALNKKVMGKGDTLKVQLCSVSNTWFLDEEDYDDLTPEIEAIKFRTNDDFINEFPTKKQIDIIGSLNISEFIKWKPIWELIKTKQILIEDYRVVN